MTPTITAVTDPNGNTTSYGFDALNRNTTITNPLLSGQSHAGVTTMTYDADDNMVTLTDPDGNTTTYAFDALDRQTKMTDPSGASATYAYDADNNLTSETDRDGRLDNYTYDPLNRETNETWKVSGATVNLLTFSYDADNNMLTAANYAGAYTMAYDVLDRMTSEQEPFGLALTFNYDGDDNRTLVQDSFGGVLTSVYDALDRLTSRQFGGASQTPARFDMTYNSRNDISTMTRYSNLAGTATVALTTYSYDADDRVTNIIDHNSTGGILANFTYGYDLGSRLTTETADGSTRTFQYDTNNELTNDGINTYTYDLNGNRTMTGYTTGTGNELTSDGTWTFTYDGEGNNISKRNISTHEVWSYSYDNDNRLLTAKDVSGSGTTLSMATYIYDVFGDLIEEDTWTQSAGTTVSRFGYDGDQVWVDLNGSNQLQMRYLRGDQEDQLVARISSAGAVAWYLTDWEGSVRNLIDNTGTLQDTVTYDGFGDITSETNATFGGAYKFDGMRVDPETGYFITWGRMGAPPDGRWIQQDPMGFNAGDPNLYREDGNAPSNFTDPSGLWLTVGGRPINQPSDIDPSYENNPVARMMVLVLVKAPRNVRYASKSVFALDVSLRSAILQYCQGLNGTVNFPPEAAPGELPNKATAPPGSRYWQTRNGQILFKGGPDDYAAAIKEIFDPRFKNQFSFECNSALYVVYSRALIGTIGDKRYNRLMRQLSRRHKVNFTIGGAGQTVPTLFPFVQQYGGAWSGLPGDWVYRQHPSGSGAWTGENLIIGSLPQPYSYFGHPYGWHSLNGIGSKPQERGWDQIILNGGGGVSDMKWDPAVTRFNIRALALFVAWNDVGDALQDAWRRLSSLLPKLAP